MLQCESGLPTTGISCTRPSIWHSRQTAFISFEVGGEAEVKIGLLEQGARRVSLTKEVDDGSNCFGAHAAR